MAYYGTGSTTPSRSGPHGFGRQPGRSDRGPRPSRLERWDDVKDDTLNFSEGTTEQAHEARAHEKPDGMLERSDEGTSQTDVLYRICCHDNKEMRLKNFTTGENPFEERALLDLENSQTPMIIEIIIDVTGAGSSPDWDIDYAAERYADDWGQKYRSPPSPPPPRARNYLDFNSDVSDDYDEDFVVGDRFENPVRSRTFRVNKRTPESLNEVLNKGIFRASVVNWKQINIYSRNLLQLFRSVVQRYPGQSLKGEKIVVNPPFGMLAHYYNDLNALRNGTLDIQANVSHEGFDEEQPGQRTQADLLDEATLYDLNVLLRAFKWHYVKKFAPEEASYNLGVTSYILIWFLFKPGVDVYARIGGKIAGFVFEWCEKRERPRRAGDYDSSTSFWVIHCWNLTFNGRRIVKTSHEFYIDKFRGERQITSLPVFPSIYLDNLDCGKTRARLQDLGEKYYNILRQSPAHMQYCGLTWDLEREVRDETARQKWKPEIEYDGEIVLDHRRNRNFTRMRSRSPDYVVERQRGVTSSAEESSDSGNDEQPEIVAAPVVGRKAKALRSSFKSVNPKEQESLTPHHCFLLPRRMNGFALAKKQRMGFDVENIEPIIWPPREIDPMSTLILDESDKDVVKALARKYSRGQGTWGADFVEGKGEGQIFLLHGPPGTGKTYTVECVAKYTRRPLLRLTVADIGTDERQMEDILGEWFQRGADWGAIILIDEADVFLEKRQVKDLQRNSLVSVFLSCMEYYTGMLFLTTNRIGQIDDAFLSRTSVALTYRTLDIGKQRHIWQGFLKKLAEERKDIALTDRAKKFLENLDKDETTKDVPWNGREIRNALQTAIALASFDAEEEAEENGVRPSKILVRDTHFQTVVDRRKEFIAYRRSIRNQDEEARAFLEGNRAPPPKKG